jgi:hypothetical protein
MPVGVGDTCADPLTHAWPGTASGSTVGFSNDYDTTICGGGSGPDVVYSLLVTSPANFTIDTNGSSFDTVLNLMDDTCAEIACDDDGGSGTQSLISQHLTNGTYYIVVDGYSGSGSYVLNVN